MANNMIKKVGKTNQTNNMVNPRIKIQMDNKTNVFKRGNKTILTHLTIMELIAFIKAEEEVMDTLTKIITSDHKAEVVVDLDQDFKDSVLQDIHMVTSIINQDTTKVISILVMVCQPLAINLIRQTMQLQLQ